MCILCYPIQCPPKAVTYSTLLLVIYFNIILHYNFCLESGIKRMMKKFVNKDGVKMQEDMAWQVAEMIVKGVTSVTLASNDEDYEGE